MSVINVVGFKENSFSIYIVYLIIFTLSYFTFLLCDFAYKRPKLGTFLLVIISSIFLIVSYLTINYNSNIIDFILSLKYNTLQFKFQLIVMVGGIFLTSCICYYFTNIGYRSYIFFMLVFFPIIFYQTRKVDFPDFYIKIFVILFLAIIIDSHKKLFSKELNKNYFISLIKICLILSVIVFLVPNISKTPYSIIDILDKTDSDSNEFMSSNRISGKNYSSNNEQELFRMTADNPVYLKRQVFGSYENPNSNYWIYVKNDDLRKGGNIYVEDDVYFEQKFLIPEVLGILLSRACELDSDFRRNNFDHYIDLLKDTKLELKKGRIFYTNFSSYTLPSPLGTVKTKSNNFETFKNSIGEVFALDLVPKQSYYDFEYFDYTQSEDSRIISEKLDFETYKKIVYELEEFYRILNFENELKIIGFFKNEVDKIDEYLSDNNYTVPEKTAELAKKITENSKSDYEKAFALQNYFQENDFLYDTNYRPPVGKEGNEYFLFESKRGTCSDYATSMTLMGKSVGLIIRYTEGFLPKSEESGNEFIIRNKNSHAYPEVYIAGYGWVVFEPTVSRLAEEAKDIREYYGKFEIYLILAILSLFILLGVLFLIKKFIFPSIKEALFIQKIKIIEPSNAIILIYKKIIKLISLNEKLPADSFTPNMVFEYLLKNYNLNSGSFIKIYEKLAFDNTPPSAYDKADAIKLYVTLSAVHKEKMSSHR